MLLREQIQHFNRERIPERVVHAKELFLERPVPIRPNRRGNRRRVGMIGVCRGKTVLLDGDTGALWTSGACTESDCGSAIPALFCDWFHMAYA